MDRTEEPCFHAISKNIVLKNLYSIFGSLSISYLGEISARVPLSQPFTKPISIHYGSPCFLNRFRITFCAFQEGPRPNRHLQDILFLRGATCVAFYVIALMGNSCSVKSEIVLNYCEAGKGNWHYVKTPHHQFACQQHTSKSAETNWNHLKTHSGERSNKCNQILLCTVYILYTSWNQRATIIVYGLTP